MRLNGWVRIGIIASIAWAFVGGSLGNALVIGEAMNAITTRHQNCTYRPDDGSPVECQRQASADYNEAVKYHWHAAAIVAFVPIPFAWLLVSGLVVLVRWVRAGFAPDANR